MTLTPLIIPSTMPLIDGDKRGNAQERAKHAGHERPAKEPPSGYRRQNASKYPALDFLKKKGRTGQENNADDQRSPNNGAI